MDRKGKKINKEEIPGSKRSMYGYTMTYSIQALKGERLSSVFSPEGTLISASAAPLCGDIAWNYALKCQTFKTEQQQQQQSQW